MIDKKAGDERINSCAYFSSLIYEDFMLLKKKRGKLWDSLNLMKKRISKLPNKSFWEIYDNFLDNTKRNYYKKIHDL